MDAAYNAVGHSGGVPNESTAIAVTARDLADYRHMFALGDDMLAQCAFLDCASGASTFGAELRARGGQVLPTRSRRRIVLAV